MFAASRSAAPAPFTTYTVKPFLRCMVDGTPAVIYSGESIFEHDDLRLRHFETPSHPLGQKWSSSG
jgi:hypothetical protein